jgi:hypothetical protein
MTEPASGHGPMLTEEQLLEIITFLVSSAEICLHEPRYYGTFRLVDGASRLIGKILENNPELTSGFLAEYKKSIDMQKTQMMFDRESYYQFLREIPAAAAAELKRIRESGATS